MLLEKVPFLKHFFSNLLNYNKPAKMCLKMCMVVLSDVCFRSLHAAVNDDRLLTV